MPAETSAERRHRIESKVCGDKKAYGTSKHARNAARLFGESVNDDRLSQYRCPFCKKWHIGHAPSVYNLQEIADVIRGLPTPWEISQQRERR